MKKNELCERERERERERAIGRGRERDDGETKLWAKIH